MKFVAFLILVSFFILPSAAFAQEFTLSPQTATLNPNQTYEFELSITGAANSNATNIHLIFDSSINLENFVQVSESTLLFVPEQCGNTFISGNELCLSAASTSGSFIDPQPLGTISLSSTTSTPLNFDNGSRSSVVVGGQEILLSGENIESTPSLDPAVDNQFNSEQNSEVDSAESSSFSTTQFAIIGGLVVFIALAGAGVWFSRR